MPTTPRTQHHHHHHRQRPPSSPNPNDPVVARLVTNGSNNNNNNVHPYSSVAMSPNRSHAIVAGKDTLQLIDVSPAGLQQQRSFRISQHFQTLDNNSMAKIYEDTSTKNRASLRDTFGFAAAPPSTAKQQSPAAISQQGNVNVMITDVAWSKTQRLPTTNPSTSETTILKKDSTNNGGSNTGSTDDLPASASNIGSSNHNTTPTVNHELVDDEDLPNPTNNTNNKGNPKEEPQQLDSIVAAAGSNGVVVVWSAKRAFLDLPGNQQPEAILCQHTRAVNRLAFHPCRPGMLLTASQDATCKLWVRQAKQPQQKQQQQQQQQQANQLSSWFRFTSGAQAPAKNEQSFMWYCKATFEPKSEAVRDIRWSPFHDDIFALVTVSGSLIVYNMFVTVRPIVKISAHSGDATTLDWHPTRPYVIATGGAGDRCVKIWDLESSLVMKKDEANIMANSNTVDSKTDSVATESSSETNRSGSYSSTIGSSSGMMPMRSLSFSLLNSTRHKSSSAVSMLHVLTVSATVTRLKWRPPAWESFPNTASSPTGSEEATERVDRHEPMLAVATAPIKGASAGGSGVLGLWSYHRPFMPLSVLEGHQIGAVADFFFLDTPQVEVPAPSAQAESTMMASSSSASMKSLHEVMRMRKGSDEPDLRQQQQPQSLGVRSDSDGNLYGNTKKYDGPGEDRGIFLRNGMGIWQHVLSVGRDGCCLIQSFARGDRPISRVPPSCFAMSNKSPFSSGFGSLQICSVHQKVPSGPKHDFWLAGIRRDAATARAPGIFRELPPNNDLNMEQDVSVGGRRLPDHVPQLIFNVVDRGDLEGSTPVSANEQAMTVAPEVVHLSRFAKQYVLHPNEEFPTRVDICLHNGEVAASLQCGHLSRMWKTLAHMLEGSGLDGLPDKNIPPDNVMQFVLFPTIKSLLLERADAGDVQTCVTLCEVLQVIQPNETTKVPGLSLNLVREWYLTYIDLLRDMCLFSLSSAIIGMCKDPFIGALNQQSTTIAESCPRCGKPLLPSQSGEASSLEPVARRECKSCRRRIGLCFLCHEPVKGVYVWCPGCGHGGHLDHALQWFGGLGGRTVREVCPTGCGHKCNFMQQLSAFPRTKSLKNITDATKLGRSSPPIDMLPAGLM